MFKGLIQELTEMNKQKRENNEQYTPTEICRVVRRIFSLIEGYYSPQGATPIVRIVKDFGFKAYKETMDINLSGDINIQGNTSEVYGHDKVIVVNKEDHLFHQRFVVAHELAHYLFDYLGNDNYESHPDIKFSEAYLRNQHNSESEARANVFAAEIMMPKDMFLKQYEVAKGISNDRLTILSYLSRFFETTEESIVRRIEEVSAVGR